MGNRASYVLIEDGSPAFHYSHWGALSTPEVILSGPVETVAYIRALDPRDGLLTATWAEGGILLDLDGGILLFFGGDGISSYPFLRRILLRILRRVWQGWSVDYARHGMADFAQHLGLDPASVLTTDPQGDVRYATLAEVGDADPELEAHVVTVSWPDGTVSDYRLPHYARGIAALGPDLLPALQRRAPVALPHEDESTLSKPHLDDGVYIDVPNKTIWLWDAGQLDPRWLEEIRRAWPGWRVEGHLEGVVRQAALSGRDPAPYMVPDAEAAQRLVAVLSSDWSVGAGALLEAVINDPPLGTKRIEVARGFLRADPPPLTAPQRRELLEHVLGDSMGHGGASMLDQGSE